MPSLTTDLAQPIEPQSRRRADRGVARQHRQAIAPGLRRRIYSAEFIDPWSFAAAHTAGARWWHDGRHGLSFAAWGCAASLSLGMEDDLAIAHTWCSSLREQIRLDATDSRSDALPLLFAGGAFDRQLAFLTTWKHWPQLEVRVPRVIAFRHPDHGAGFIVHEMVTEPADTLQLPDRQTLPPAASQAWSRIDDPATEQHYHAGVQRILNDIDAGTVHKVVLARSMRAQAHSGAAFDPAATARRLRDAHPDAFCFLVGRADEAFVGATPELLARVDSGNLSTQALAGTRKADAAGLEAARLLSSSKDGREHDAVLRAIQRDLAPLCTDLGVAPSCTVVRAGPVQHLSTAVSGVLKPDVGLLAVAAALHPTPALGGAPKETATRWLRQHESLERGWYGAPIGWLSPSGDGVLAVAIRSALLRPNVADAFAGAGIVRGSEPASEWRETEAKLQTIVRCLCTAPHDVTVQL